VAEIRIERRRGVLPWILGVALLALVVTGLVLVLADRDAGRLNEAREAGNIQEGPQETPKTDAKDVKKDQTPRHLQQWVSIEESDPARAA
jgi:hypothetical protein